MTELPHHALILDLNILLHPFTRLCGVWWGGGPRDFSVSPRPLGFGFLGLGLRGLGLTTSKTDNVLTEHGGLLHVLPLGVQGPLVLGFWVWGLGVWA